MSVLAVLSNLDLVSVLAAYLPISDLFRASSVSTTLCSLLSNDRVWLPLLSAALALSTVAPVSPSCLPLPLSVPIPPTVTASRLCREGLFAHLRAVAAAHGHRTVSASTTATIIAIRRQPGSLSYHMRAALQGGSSAKRVGEALNEIDCRSYELEWIAEKRDWRVAEVGEAGSGRSVLNAVDEGVINSGSTDSYDCKEEAGSCSWDIDETATTVEEAAQFSDMCKQQYIRSFACSCHPQYRCFRILAPRSPLPAPSPAAKDAYPGHFNELSFPLLSYPALSPVPVCHICRTSVAVYLSSKLNSNSVSRSRFPVRCIVRVNACEWDVCYAHYEHGWMYRRIQLQWRYDRLNSGGGWYLERLYRAHSGAYCNQLPVNVDQVGRYSLYHCS